MEKLPNNYTGRFPKHTHINQLDIHDGTDHDHGANQTHYPGAGVDAKAEVTIAMNVFIEKLARLSVDDQDCITYIMQVGIQNTRFQTVRKERGF